MQDAPDLAALLARVRAGEEGAEAALINEVHGELRAMAARYLAGECQGHTLQPTALVHEAYLKRAGSDPGRLAGRAQFFHAAARAMRQLLVDHARSRASLKRGGDRVRVQADLASIASGERPEELLAVEEALSRLEGVDARCAEVVRLRIFAGLDVATVAQVLGLSTRTVEREWAYARTWIYEALK
jgi:RNA polymerase sigma-70 factor (ECF subfamily)